MSSRFYPSVPWGHDPPTKRCLLTACHSFFWRYQKNLSIERQGKPMWSWSWEVSGQPPNPIVSLLLLKCFQQPGTYYLGIITVGLVCFPEHSPRKTPSQAIGGLPFFHDQMKDFKTKPSPQAGAALVVAALVGFLMFHPQVKTCSRYQKHFVSFHFKRHK